MIVADEMGSINQVLLRNCGVLGVVERVWGRILALKCRLLGRITIVIDEEYSVGGEILLPMLRCKAWKFIVPVIVSLIFLKKLSSRGNS